MDEIIQYFNEELNYLRNSGEVFSKKHPQLASKLRISNAESVDPFVGKIIESFAFLTARISQKLDDGYAEINDAILDTVLPHLTKPFPSFSNINISPKKSTNLSHNVPEKTIIDCSLEDKTNYKFMTVYETEILPLIISKTSFENSPFANKAAQPGAKSRLEINLSMHNKDITLKELKPKKIRFYLRLEDEYAFILYELIFNNAIAVTIQSKKDNEERHVVKNITPVGFSAEEGMLPFPNNSFLGYRLLTEYFLATRKFLYFDVNLTDDIWRGIAHDSALIIYFNKINKTLSKVVDKKSLSLNTTPIVNIYKRKSTPININNKDFEYSLFPEKLGAEGGSEVYSVDELVSVTSDDKVGFHPYFGLKYDSKGKEKNIFWHLRRRTSFENITIEGINNNLQVSFTDLSSKKITLPAQVAEASMLCVNTDLYEKIYIDNQKYSFNFWSDEFEFAQSMGCVSSISNIRRPKLGNHDKWKAISHLGLNLKSMSDGEIGILVLKEMLTIYNNSGNHEYEKLIKGLDKIEVVHQVKRIKINKKSGFCNGVVINIYLTDECLVLPGLYLFGCILRRFFLLYISVNNFIQLNMLNKKGEGVYQWEPWLGNQKSL